MTPIWKMRGLSLREVGEFFGGMDYAAVAQQIRWTRVDLYKRTLAPDMDSDVIEKDYKSIDMPKVRCDFGELDEAVWRSSMSGARHDIRESRISSGSQLDYCFKSV